MGEEEEEEEEEEKDMEGGKPAGLDFGGGAGVTASEELPRPGSRNHPPSGNTVAPTSGGGGYGGRSAGRGVVTSSVVSSGGGLSSLGLGGSPRILTPARARR